MKGMKLLLTDDEGTVLETWSIGLELDFDPEVLASDEGEHDFYAVPGFVDAQELGESVFRVVWDYKRNLVEG